MKQYAKIDDMFCYISDNHPIFRNALNYLYWRNYEEYCELVSVIYYSERNL